MTRVELEDVIKAVTAGEPFTMPFFLITCAAEELKRQRLMAQLMDKP